MLPIGMKQSFPSEKTAMYIGGSVFVSYSHRWLHVNDTSLEACRNAIEDTPNAT
jgi:hypothetical protein